MICLDVCDLSLLSRYLALVAAMACEADFVLIPESPVADGWEDQLCNKLKRVKGFT